jgi:signal transduction histidine kinase
MPDRLERDVRQGFDAETRRLLARRVPLGVSFSLVLAAVAGFLELAYFPGRLPALATSFAGETVLGLIAVVASRQERLRAILLPLVAATTLGIALLVVGYVVEVRASGDALAFALIVFLCGAALIFPWGAWGQVPVAVGVSAAYLAALATGVRGELPLPYGLLSVAGCAVTSVIGARFLDLHRRAIFQQRLQLERRRDEQLATLYDVTRAVTATLELPQVLWLVCQRVLDVLGLERLWLLWREAPDGALRGLAARRDGMEIQVTEIEGDGASWEDVLQSGADSQPSIVPPGADEARFLGGADPLPQHLLRLPLVFQSELVGIILGDRGGTQQARESSFLDFAATLGNSAAMAIANARLYALVLQHRAELLQLSNKRLDVIEEGMRRVSRELHDGICQALMAVKLDLALLQRQLPAEQRNAVQDIRAQVIDVAQGVRQMSHLLHPPVLDDFGPVAAIESITEKYRATSELEIRLTAPNPGLRFAPSIELMLFRVFQEALINVVKHSGARRVSVRIAAEDDAVVLEISDDGKGFDAHAYFRMPPASAGLGLIGMRERVAHFGGVFRVTSRPGAGTRIYVSAPAEPVPAVPVAAAL